MKTPKLIDINLSVENDVAIATLDRDDVRNALTGTAMIEDIISLCNWINSNHEIGAMVITGSGKAFSAGGNIKDMRDRKGDIFGIHKITFQNTDNSCVFKHQTLTRDVYANGALHCAGKILNKLPGLYNFEDVIN